MKQHLFDKIIINGEHVDFMPYREPTFSEKAIYQSEYKFSPKSFKSFLSFLSKTSLNDNNEFDIKESLYVIINDMPVQKPISFDSLLKKFASLMYKKTTPDTEKLKEFYSAAQKIKKEAVAKNKYSQENPEELI